MTLLQKGTSITKLSQLCWFLALTALDQNFFSPPKLAQNVSGRVTVVVQLAFSLSPAPLCFFTRHCTVRKV